MKNFKLIKIRTAAPLTACNFIKTSPFCSMPATLARRLYWLNFKNAMVCYGLAGLLCTGAAFAQSPVTLTIDTRAPGYAILPDFTGVSIFTGTQVSGHRGASGSLFSASNTQLITLFTNSGIHHLRLGATGSASSDERNLDTADIDSLFAFAKITGITVIYSLHARDGVATAQYIWNHYRSNLDCFAFDNEPDKRWDLTGWQNFAQSVIAAVPGAKFTGPDAAGRTLAPNFADDEKNSGILAFVTQHTYVGGNPKKRKVTSAQQAIDIMLSKKWDTDNYPTLYRQVFLPIKNDRLPVRLTESDDYTHGVAGASDAFASALWALDYMHWWAAHDARGVNFQNTEWLTTDTFHLDSAGNYQINPKAYGIKAFDLGSHGRVEPVNIANADDLNLTAYAVGDAKELDVTVINKEHGQGARVATVTIVPNGFSSVDAKVMFLTAPNGDIGAINGVTLGGSPILNDAPWRGQWTALDPAVNGLCTVTVPASSAVVVKISAP